MIQKRFKLAKRFEPEIALTAFDKIPIDDISLDKNFYQSEIEDGAKLYDLIDASGKHVYTLCKKEGKEFVIIAAISEDGIFDAVKEGLEVLENEAKNLGCVTVRFSTMRNGLVKKAKDNGYRIAEVILRKDLI